MREVLNESNVCFYTPEDFDSLSSQFSRLISDAQWRSQLAATAQENAVAYDWRRRMTRILEGISVQMDVKK
jgi:glycosyltransferase involved in cell wall biosynthesis